MRFDDFEHISREVLFRDGAIADAYQVQEVLMYGTAQNLEPWEIAAIQREAAVKGIYA